MSVKRRSYVFVQDGKESIVEHFELVQGRVEEFTRQAKHLSSVIKKKVNLDKEHVKAIQKMTQSMHEDTSIRQLKFEGSLEVHWSNVKEQLAAEAMRVSSVASTVEQQGLQPLQVYMLADLDKRFHNLVQDGRRLIKDYLNAKAVMIKSRDKYFGYASEWESSLLAIYSEEADSWNPTIGNKLYERETILCRRMEEGKTEYEAIVLQTNALQSDILGSQLPQVLESLRNVTENMVAVVNNTLKCFSNMQQLLVSDKNLKGKEWELFNAADYCQKVIFDNVTVDSIPPPVTFPFNEYPFKDNALIIQAKKIQYQCMSKLSAKELANRGHQFLANGDKRKSAVVSQQKEQSMKQDTTANKYLISTCLEYLHQPFALKEEGLFRVSGDSSIMKSLLLDFSSGKATKEFLHMAVMSQKDPNNISGLLKMHLRECTLLTDETAKIINDVISQDMNGLLHSVLSVLSSAELQLLTDIIKLLHTMVQQPWKAENKMTAHTLGIACGLSLFPQLDPSKATAFTQYLIDNYGDLQGSHNFL